MDIDEVRTWDIEKLWNFLKKEKVPMDVYQKVRYGKINIDVNIIINREYRDYTVKGFIKIMGRKMEKEELYSDLEEREKVAFQWIKENYQNRPIVGGRYAK